MKRDMTPRSRSHYLNNGTGSASWLLTKDHKRIAILYLISITVFFFVGGASPCSSARAADAGGRPDPPTPTTSCSPCTA
jgi:hypothetical protein